MIQLIKDYFIGTHKCRGYESRRDLNGNLYYSEPFSSPRKLRTK